MANEETDKYYMSEKPNISSGHVMSKEQIITMQEKVIT